MKNKNSKCIILKFYKIDFLSYSINISLYLIYLFIFSNRFHKSKENKYRIEISII